MRDTVLLAVDPGVTTGWAIMRADGQVLGMGDLAPEELGCALDLLVRTMHRLGYTVRSVVEDVPKVKGTQGRLSLELEFVNRTVDHWLSEVFELQVSYVPPGRWKTSRVAATCECVDIWNGCKTSQHMKDAYMLARYQSDLSERTI
jgi:hypothetical protein